MLYLRFVVCLAIGLFGVALFMSTLMDALLSEWDLAAEVQGMLAKFSKKHNQIVGVESMYGSQPLSTRLASGRRPEDENGKAFAGLNAGAGLSAGDRLSGSAGAPVP